MSGRRIDGAAVASRAVDRLDMPERRRFLGGSASVALALAAIPLLTPEAFAATLTGISPEQGATLVRLARDIFPHDRLGDDAYRGAVASLESQMQGAGKSGLLSAGCVELDRIAGDMRGTPYARIAAEEQRVALLRTMEASDFFRAVRGGLVTALYDHEPIWPGFHYEGSSAEKGGYLRRGFDDLEWL